MGVTVAYGFSASTMPPSAQRNTVSPKPSIGGKVVLTVMVGLPLPGGGTLGAGELVGAGETVGSEGPPPPPGGQPGQEGDGGQPGHDEEGLLAGASVGVGEKAGGG